MSTPEQHLALFHEILAEMTPEQLIEALKPIELDCRLDFSLEVQEQPALSFDRFYNAVVIRPEAFFSGII